MSRTSRVKNVFSKEYYIRKRLKASAEYPAYTKDIKMNSFLLKGVRFYDARPDLPFPVARMDLTQLDLDTLLRYRKTHLQFHHLYGPYLNHVYINKDWDSLCDYLYMLYADYEYHYKIMVLGVPDQIFTYLYFKCGCTLNYYFKDLFKENYHDMLTHTLLKMRRASFPKYDIGKSNYVGFTVQAFKQVFVTGWIDFIRGQQVGKMVLQGLINYVPEIEIHAEEYQHQHGFDLLLDLSNN